jgi:hypothetical protein
VVDEETNAKASSKKLLGIPPIHSRAIVPPVGVAAPPSPPPPPYFPADSRGGSHKEAKFIGKHLDFPKIFNSRASVRISFSKSKIFFANQTFEESLRLLVCRFFLSRFLKSNDRSRFSSGFS